MSKGKHTPTDLRLPWHRTNAIMRDPPRTNARITDSDGMVVGLVTATNLHTDLILRACNRHDRLVAACEQAQRALTEIVRQTTGKHKGTELACSHDARNMLTAALAEAKEKP